MSSNIENIDLKLTYENHELDFDLLISASLEIGNKLGGLKISENNPNIYFAEGLGQKIINHILTARYLFKGYQLGSGTNLFEPKIDFGSIAILTRAALETYLTLNYVFIAENNVEEKKFRFLCWHLAGYLERSEFEPTNDTHRALKNSEKIEIEKLKNELSENLLFQKLSTKNKVKVLTGQWRINNSWSQIAIKAGFNKPFFDKQYKFLCAYAHSSRLSIIQIQQNKTLQSQKDMAFASISVLIVILAKHMYDYIEIIPQLHSVKSEMDKYPIIFVWKSIGEKI